MRIHFLSARTYKAHCYTYPIQAFAKQLNQLGLVTRLYYGPSPSLLKCDVLCILGDHFHRQNPTARAEIIDTVKAYRCHVRGLVWCDVTDSTGTPFFEILPVVDLYAKNQLLKDRTLYTQHLYGLRYYTDYYHRLRGIVDENPMQRRVATDDELGKLAVAWNIGLGDYVNLSRLSRRVRIFWPWANYPKKATPGDWAERTIDVSYRATNTFKRATASFPRQETRRQLSAIAESQKYRIAYDGKLAYRQYQKELRQSLILPSPFGLGEICFRDFECFLAGAALLKPDMSHMDTWPDYFQPWVTYIPHKWDFSDFQTRIQELLDAPTYCQHIAKAGQAYYTQSLSAAGGEAFARRLAGLMQQAVDNRQTY
jgi:hypothetical protein